MKKLVLVLAGLFLVVSCAPTYYCREGATELDLKKDVFECKSQCGCYDYQPQPIKTPKPEKRKDHMITARRSDSIGDGFAELGNSMGPGIARGRCLNECLESKGWVKGTKDCK